MNGLLNKQFLQDIGVTLDDQTYETLSEHYEETLNERVIIEIVDELDEKQLEELHSLTSQDDSMLNQWLVANIPKLDEIIEDEIAILLGEITESSQKI
jgi:hypothetical protein